MSSFAQNVGVKKIVSKFMSDSIALTIRAMMGIDANDGFIVLHKNHAGQFVIQWFVTNCYPVYSSNTFHPHRVPVYLGTLQNFRSTRFTAASIEPEPSRH